MHIPKTAGISLREILQRIYAPDRLVLIYSQDGDHLNALRTDVERAQAICGHVSFGIHEFYGIDARYITFLRHPVDRVLSLYRHQARSADNALHPLIADGMTLKDILRSGEFHEYNNHMVRIIEPLDDRGLVDMAESNLNSSFDFVGITERFDESVALMCKTLGWTPQPVPRLNVDADRRLFAVDDETRDDILRCNALDVELYGRVTREQPPYTTPTTR